MARTGQLRSSESSSRNPTANIVRMGELFGDMGQLTCQLLKHAAPHDGEVGLLEQKPRQLALHR